jgi:hypothetical protein
MKSRQKLKFIELKKMIVSLNESIELVKINKNYIFDK